jgi:hypothetical protein
MKNPVDAAYAIFASLRYATIRSGVEFEIACNLHIFHRTCFMPHVNFLGQNTGSHFCWVHREGFAASCIVGWAVMSRNSHKKEMAAWYVMAG